MQAYSRPTNVSSTHNKRNTHSLSYSNMLHQQLVENEQLVEEQIHKPSTQAQKQMNSYKRDKYVLHRKWQITKQRFTQK